VLVMLDTADGLMTEFLIKNNIAREANPFLLAWAGEPGFLALKVTGVLLAALILWDIHRRHPRLAFRLALFFMIIYGVIVFWNLSLVFWG
jgi:hypothetical protein